MAHQEFEARPLLLYRRRLLGVLVVIGVVLLQIAVQYVASRDRLRALTLVLFMSAEMPVLMLVLSFGYAWAVRRHLRTWLTLIAGIALAAGIGATFGALIWLLAQRFPLIRFHAESIPQWGRSLAFGATYGQFHFGLWALAFVFPFAIEDAKLHSLEAEKLRLEAEQLRSLTELSKLRANLEPHFLLNTLNAIAGLVTEDPREARRLLVCLGDLLRDALHDENELQPLSAQVEWLHRYAEILQARYPKVLSFKWEVDQETQAILVPRLLLQPLVENAVKHGALRRTDGQGEVRFSTGLVRPGAAGGTWLECSIEDNGPGLNETTRTAAFGLRAVRRRLELKYGSEGALTLESSGTGTRATVRLPTSSVPIS